MEHEALVLLRYVVRLYPSSKNDAPVKTHFYKAAQWRWTEDMYEARLFRWHYQAERIAGKWRRDVINSYWRCSIDQILCIQHEHGKVQPYGAGAELDVNPSPTP